MSVEHRNEKLRDSRKRTAADLYKTRDEDIRTKKNALSTVLGLNLLTLERYQFTLPCQDSIPVAVWAQPF